MKVSFFLLIAIGVHVYGLKNGPTTGSKLSNYLDLSNNGVDAFDVSEKWPKCKDVFEDIQVQGNCSSSWAISVATSIRDRRCIRSGIKEPISAYDLISCCSNCQLDGKNGCNGGDHDSAFQYFINQGIVSGGAYRSHKGCKPYLIRPESTVDRPNNTECVKSCDSSYTKNDYQHDKIKGIDQITFSFSNQDVMDEIIKNGPVVSEFTLYEDFFNYSGDIYQQKMEKSHGYYYAKIVGWGKNETNGLLYWKAAASFGKNWGENGMFYIRRGTDECGFESSIIAGIVEDSSDFRSTTTTETSKPVDINCPKITAYFNGTFEDLSHPPLQFDAQMQISADINFGDKRLYFHFDNYNRNYQDDYEFGLWNDTDYIVCNSSRKEPCSIPFKNMTYFKVWFWPFEYFGFGPHLIWADPLINNSFTLVNAVGNCATTLKSDIHYSDTSLYKNCFCCGDKYNPDPSLGCPTSPWA